MGSSDPKTRQKRHDFAKEKIILQKSALDSNLVTLKGSKTSFRANSPRVGDFWCFFGQIRNVPDEVLWQCITTLVHHCNYVLVVSYGNRNDIQKLFSKQ